MDAKFEKDQRRLEDDLLAISKGGTPPVLSQEENLSSIKSVRKNWKLLEKGEDFFIWQTPTGTFRETIDKNRNKRLTRIMDE
jgi:hypothetical protein